MEASDRKQTALRPLVPGVLILVLALGAWLPACSAQDSSGKVLAKVNGQTITEADVKAHAAESLAQLDHDYQQHRHDLIESELQQLVRDRMVEAEAAARKLGKDQILAEIKPADVTDAQVDAFYEQNKARIPPGTTKEQVAPQIRQFLQQQGQTEAKEKFYTSLEAKYKAEYLLEPLRVDVVAAGFPAKGGANAPVTIVEFSDFQCPFCSRVVPTLEKAMAQYGDKVRLVFRQYPLPMHPNAAKAAEAALCANEQGKFWQMHDAMFKDQSGLAVDALKSKAAGLGLNATQFNACLDSSKEAEAVKSDMQAGSSAGVSGTPALFINGRFLNGAVPYEQVSKVIDDELRRKGLSKGTS
ncbi:MAG: thioredoxin domain-containing protein [Acidobacteriota bacterium]|nr:thioredoxin domain-containing protein [Acidobacteriota bacterium]